MTVRELINNLLNYDMDKEVMIYLNEPHTDEYNTTISGYEFHIKKINKFSDIIEIEFLDWRKKGDTDGR